MGTINHNAVIATTWDKKVLVDIQQWIIAENLHEHFLISAPHINDYVTIVLIPDGSNEGWDESADGDRLRALFVERLHGYTYEDDSSPVDWIEVGYGEYGQKILQGNCHNCFNDRAYAPDADTPESGTEHATTAAETANG